MFQVLEDEAIKIPMLSPEVIVMAKVEAFKSTDRNINLPELIPEAIKIPKRDDTAVHIIAWHLRYQE